MLFEAIPESQPVVHITEGSLCNLRVCFLVQSCTDEVSSFHNGTKIYSLKKSFNSAFCSIITGLTGSLNFQHLWRAVIKNEVLSQVLFLDREYYLDQAAKIHTFTLEGIAPSSTVAAFILQVSMQRDMNMCTLLYKSTGVCWYGAVFNSSSALLRITKLQGEQEARQGLVGIHEDAMIKSHLVTLQSPILPSPGKPGHCQMLL
ncbi:hypothetical protein Nmel_004725 [Mimus melanotis]